MRFGSVCSGIEAASVAWYPLGWSAAWLAEIEPSPSAVLAHHYPTTPNLGDMTKIAAAVRAGVVEAPDVLVGGTPCQAFSIAGLRGGLSDPRGQLTLAFCDIANAIDEQRTERGETECVITWENVPGVLSSADNAFGCFLAALVGEECALQPPGKRWPNAGAVFGPQRAAAWRILDAQYFGVAQRRRRVFVVASARKGFDPAGLLFEREGVRRDTPPSRSKEQEPAGTLAGGARKRGGFSYDDVPLTFGGGATGEIDLSPALTAHPGRMDFDTEAFCVTGDVTHTLKAEGFDASEDGTGRGQPIVTAYTTKLHNTKSNNAGKLFEERTPCLDANSPPPALLTANAVRRLTPRECERLQGFPDDYTLVPVGKRLAEDGPRYKALGNSMAVPVMRWIGERIKLALMPQDAANDNTAQAEKVA